MKPAPQQRELLPRPTPISGTAFVNDRLCFRTEETRRIISVQGIVFAHYSIEDRAAEAYSMVMLFESGYADQNDIARRFGYSIRTLRRYQRHLESDGLAALARPKGRPSGSSSAYKEVHKRDRIILRLKAKGRSNRWIGDRLGLDEKQVRRSLRQLGWRPSPEAHLPFFPEADLQTESATVSADESSGTLSSVAEQPPRNSTRPRPNKAEKSLDADPFDRSTDRLLAGMGLLDDALPVFAPAPSLPRAGVLLAVPPLVASGLLPVAEKIYGSIGPAFYRLRTTLVAYVLLALPRIPRPEALKEHAPRELGRIVGLDRILEVKTLRRKLTRLASLKGSYPLGRELARLRIAERGKMLGFLYIDGHVRAYHGKWTIPKAYVTRVRLTAPGTTDYWVNDQRGDPLFVVTAEANAAMTRMLIPVLTEVREMLGSRRRATIVFDRGGSSPKLFLNLLAMGFDLLTDRKGCTRRITEKRFIVRKAKLDGRRVQYLLHEQPVRFLKGKLRLRQVTRLTETGHQTPILTSRWDLRDIVVAYRMFERWRQENFFKYMREEFLVDALIDYQVEPDDPTRSAPNPARKAVEKELRAGRAKLIKLQESYGAAAIDFIEEPSSTMKSFSAAEEKIRNEISETVARIAGIETRRDALPIRVSIADAQQGQEVVKLSTERKHLTNVLKMVAYQIESDLLALIRPHYKRVEDEGRTLVQMAVQDTAAIQPTEDELRITLAPLSSSHRSRDLEALCEALNKTNTVFPGTTLRMTYSVAASPC